MSFQNEVSYDAVIPSAILFNTNLEPAAIRLYAIIKSLTRMHGYCYASNGYLSFISKVAERTVGNWLRSLIKEGYLEVETNKTGIHWQRRIYISDKFKKSLRKEENFHPPSNFLLPPLQKSATILEEELTTDKKKGEREGESEREKPKTHPPFIEGKVKIDQEKYLKLVDTYGPQKIKEYVDRLNDYADSKPKKFKEYECHAAVIRMWLKKDGFIPVIKDSPEKGHQNASIVVEARHPDAMWVDALPQRSKLQMQGKLVIEKVCIVFPEIPESVYFFGEKGFREKVENAIRKSLPVPRV